jgi:alpha-tubulin suppressor-like RCC1 family protein
MAAGHRRLGLALLGLFAVQGCKSSAHHAHDAAPTDAGRVDHPLDASPPRRSDANCTTDCGAVGANDAAVADAANGGGDAMNGNGNDGAVVDTANGGDDDASVADLAVGVSIAAGVGHTCALMSDQTVQCWGYSPNSQFGPPGLDAATITPSTVLGVVGATSISLGSSGACTVVRDGAVVCWSADLRRGSTDIMWSHWFARDSLVPAAVAVAAGGQQCAALTDGTVMCWMNYSSQQPEFVSGLSGVTKLAAGQNHTCALVADGSAWCWGQNTAGELGNGETSVSVSFPPEPVKVLGLTGATAISAGGFHTCALMPRGAVRCWGNNRSGELGNSELGNGTTSYSATPVAVTGLSGPAIAISAGDGATCALLDTGAVQCWGDNTQGQLGFANHDDNTHSHVPTVVPGLGKAIAISVAGAAPIHTCALLRDGSAKCWGTNDTSQLGDGTTVRSSAPVAVTCRPGECSGLCSPRCATCSPTCSSPACCGTSCQTAHSNGLDYAFFDCAPLGTLDEAQALRACLLNSQVASHAGTCGPKTISCGDAGSHNLVCNCGGMYTWNMSWCWEYEGPHAGQVYLGCPACRTIDGSPWN